MDYYKLKCGCELPMLGSDIKSQDGLPSIYIDYERKYEELNRGIYCPEVWSIFHSGKTKGVFQLEKNLGRSWSKRLEPSSIEEISALISILRPGTLQAFLDGKSMTQHYVDRKRGIEPSLALHNELEEFLSETYNILIYQEQIIKIAQNIAGFSPTKADDLRSAVGKKKMNLMHELEKDFIAGCIELNLVTEDEAKEIFGWIRASARYLFNKSHAVSYGFIGYISAYIKHHFPLHFYCSEIQRARSKPKPELEMVEIFQDAKNFNIDINLPNTSSMIRNAGETCIDKNAVRLGIKCIKGFGERAIEKLIDSVKSKEEELEKSIKDWNWIEFLSYACGSKPKSINATAMNNLICCGVLDFKSRNELLYEYNVFNQLTEREIDILNQNKIQDVKQGLKLLCTNVNSRRKNKIDGLLQLMENKTEDLSDSPKWIVQQEKACIGVPITYANTDTVNKRLVKDTTCKEYNDGKQGKVTIMAEITRVNPYKTKNGSIMGFLTISDGTGETDCVVFSNQYEEFKDSLTKGNILIFYGQKGDRGDGLVVNKVEEIFV